MPLILHRTAESDPTVKNEMVAFQRLFVYLMVKCNEELTTRESNLRVLHVPHKRRKLGTAAIYDSGGMRDAQVIALCDGDDLTKMEWQTYAYLGGGKIKWNPPHCYGLSANG